MAVALVASTTRATAGTTTAIDTTGATLLVVSAGAWFGAPTISDSKSNTWTALTTYVGGAGNARQFYCLSPTVGTGHTFTLGGSYASCVVYAFSGSVSTFSYQQASGNGTGGNNSPLASGSITPLSDGALVISGLVSNDPDTDTISPGGFTQTTVPNGAGSHLQHSAAWLVQTTAAAINPTWSWSGFHSYAATASVVFLDGPLPPTPEWRVTQDAVEVLSLPVPTARVTQDVVEALSLPVPEARVTQDSVEVLSLPAPTVRVTQAVVEVMSPRAVPNTMILSCSVSAPMTINGSTTPAIDTTGIDLLVWSVGWWEGGGTLTPISDSKGNTWIPLTKRGPGQYATHRFWYAKSPIVGPGHTFTAAGAGTYATQIVHGFVGAHLTDPFVTESGATTAGSSPLASGSVTPVAGSVVVSGWVQMTNPGNTSLAVTPAMEMALVPSGGYDSVATGVIQQATTTPVNPTWSWSGTAGVAVGTAVFKPALAGGSGLTIDVAETITVTESATPVGFGRVNVAAASVWTTTTATTLATPARPVTAGNTLVVAVGAVAAGGVSVAGITDSAGNTYVKADHVLGDDNYREELWYAKAITGHASNVVTVTWSTAVPYRGIVAIQYAGLDAINPLDGTAKGTAPAANMHVVTGVLTTTRPGTVQVLLPRWGLYTVDTITWPPGFSTNFSGDSNTAVSEKFVPALTAENYLIAHTNTTNAKVALVAAFATTPVLPGINVADVVSVTVAVNDAPVIVARGTGGTTAPVTTTGAGLLVIAAAWWNGSGAPSFSDSKGNTWTPLTSYGTNARVRFFYCAAPVVGGNHTFFGSIGAFIVLAFAGSYVPGAQNGAGYTAFPASPKTTGSITPTVNNALILTALSATDPGGTYAVSSPAGFTVTTMIGGASAMDDAVGYMRQTTAAAINPTWSWSGVSHGQLSVAAVAFLPTTITANVADTLTVSEGMVIGDRPPTDAPLLQAKSELLGVSEHVTVHLSLGTAPVEALTITEQVAVSFWAMQRASASETLTVTEDLTRVSHDAAKATPVDTVAVTESAAGQLLLTVSQSVADSIAVTESARALVKPMVVRVADSISLVDLTSLPIGAPLVLETIRVTDVVILHSPALVVQVADAITVSEPYMNHNTVGLGPNPTPLPGATLKDYWSVGIIP